MNNHIRHHPRQAGFTLIEVVLYIAVSAGVVAAIFSLLQLVLNGQVRYTLEAGVVQEGSWASQRFVDTVHAATTITDPVSGQTADSLTLGDGTVVSVQEGVLQLQPTAGPAQMLTSNAVVVSSLSFERSASASAGDLVRMGFTITASHGGTGGPLFSEHVFTTSSSPLR